MSSPTTPATEPETPEEKVTPFDEGQKTRINQIVKESSARAGAEARAEVARVKAELDAIKATITPSAPTVDNTLELATTRAELASLKTQQAETQLNEQLRAAAGDTFVDLGLGVRLMRDCVRVGADGKISVVNEDGSPALDAAFNALTLAGLAQRIADAKKFLARSTVKHGAGSVLGESAAPATVKLSELFGPKSNGGKANAMALRSPSEYRRLKALAREKGLI